jgi:hypothetical protein
MDKRVIGRNRRIGGRVFLCINGTPCQSEDVTSKVTSSDWHSVLLCLGPHTFSARLLLRSKRGKRKRYLDMGALVSDVISAHPKPKLKHPTHPAGAACSVYDSEEIGPSFPWKDGVDAANALSTSNDRIPRNTLPPPCRLASTRNIKMMLRSPSNKGD